MAAMLKPRSLTRRHFTVSLAALTAAGLTARAQTLATPQTLREAAASRNRLAGCAVQVARLRDTPDYTALVKQQAGIVVAESEFKFGPMRPTPTKFFFDDTDYLVHFAEQNGMKLRGHNFVWHRQLPAWLASYVTPANAEQVLVHHIETVAGRYRGKIHSWDVVNEAIQPSDKLPNDMRNSPWQKVLPDYIEIAFRTARKADPHALLCYNDYGVEGEDAESDTRRAAVLGLLRRLQAQNVPIDALGIQSHLTAGEPYGPKLVQFMNDVRALGLKLLLTEMDVNDRYLIADTAIRDRLVGDTYANYLNQTLANPDVIALLTWGITDRYTWLNHEGARKDGLPNRCLPFDADLKPVPAFYAERNALLRGPKSPPLLA